jgi:hypothetical protein
LEGLDAQAGLAELDGLHEFTAVSAHRLDGH